MKSLEFKVIKIDSEKRKAKCQKVLNAFGLKTRTSSSISSFSHLMYSNHDKIFYGHYKNLISPENNISVKQLKVLLSLELLKPGNYIVVKALVSKTNWIIKLDEVKEEGGEIIFRTKAEIRPQTNNIKLQTGSVEILGRFVRYATFEEIVTLTSEYMEEIAENTNETKLTGRTFSYIFGNEAIDSRINWEKIRSMMQTIGQRKPSFPPYVNPAILKKIIPIPTGVFFMISRNSTEAYMDQEEIELSNRKKLITAIQPRTPKVGDACVFTDFDINTTPVHGIHSGILKEINSGVKYPYVNVPNEGYRHAYPVSHEEACIIFNIKK